MSTDDKDKSPEAAKKAEKWKQDGNAFMKAKKYKEAIDSYTLAIDVSPGNHFLYSNRSQAFINLKAYEKGIEDAEETIRLNPKWFKGYSHKATALARMGRWKEVMSAATEGLKMVTDERDAGVLKQNVALARAGMFEGAILGSWQGRVSDAMGGYRQTIEFSRKGELTVSIMHRRQECKYTVRPMDNREDIFTVYFTLPYAETRTPYLAQLVTTNGQEELFLCCNADVSKSGETPRESDLDLRSGDGFVRMTRHQPPQQDEEFRKMSLSERLYTFASKYWEILNKRNTDEWSAKNPSEPGVMILALKFQSDIFDLEESVGKDVVDAFFLIAAGVDADEAQIPMNVSPDTRSAVMRVKDALISKKMLDESLLQQKKEVYLQYLEMERIQKKHDANGNPITANGTATANGGPGANSTSSNGVNNDGGANTAGGNANGNTSSTSNGNSDAAGESVIDLFQAYPYTSLGLATAALVVSALAMGYFASRRKS